MEQSNPLERRLLFLTEFSEQSYTFLLPTLLQEQRGWHLCTEGLCSPAITYQLLNLNFQSALKTQSTQFCYPRVLGFCFIHTFPHLPKKKGDLSRPGSLTFDHLTWHKVRLNCSLEAQAGYMKTLFGQAHDEIHPGGQKLNKIKTG